MERIGIAASKIAKGNLLLYNFFVVLLSLLFSLLVFFIAGSSIVIVLIAAAYFNSSGSFPDLEKGWMSIMIAVLVCLFVVVNIFSLIAIAKNLKLKKK